MRLRNTKSSNFFSCYVDDGRTRVECQAGEVVEIDDQHAGFVLAANDGCWEKVDDRQRLRPRSAVPDPDGDPEKKEE